MLGEFLSMDLVGYLGDLSLLPWLVTNEFLDIFNRNQITGNGVALEREQFG